MIAGAKIEKDVTVDSWYQDVAITFCDFNR